MMPGAVADVANQKWEALGTGTDTPFGAVAGGGNPPPPPPPQGETITYTHEFTGLNYSTALGRPDKTIESGSTGIKSKNAFDPPVNAYTYDFRTREFRLINDMGGRDQDQSLTKLDLSSIPPEEADNNVGARVGAKSTTNRFAIIGPIMRSFYKQNEGWEYWKYNWPAQVAANNGQDPDHTPKSVDGSGIAVTVPDKGWGYLAGARFYNVMDGMVTYGNLTTPRAKLYVENCIGSIFHDTVVSVEKGVYISMRNVFFLNFYGGVDFQTGPADQGEFGWEVEGGFLGFGGWYGGFKKEDRVPANATEANVKYCDRLVKDENISPTVKFTEVVIPFYPSRFRRNDAVDFPGDAQLSNVLLINMESTPFNRSIHAGSHVINTTGDELALAVAVRDEILNEYKSRMGNPDNPDSVDPDALLAAAPPPTLAPYMDL